MKFWFHRILSKYDTEEESRKCKLVSPGKYPDWRGDERKYFLGRKKGRKTMKSIGLTLTLALTLDSVLMMEMFLSTSR